MMSWMEMSESYFKWWRDAMSRYADLLKNEPEVQKQWGAATEYSLRAKEAWDRWLEETWRWWQLPSREDLTRLGERFNVLEEHLVQLREEVSRQREALGRIPKDAEPATKNDVESLIRAVNDLTGRVSQSTGPERNEDAVREVAAGLERVEEEVRRLRESVSEFGERLNAAESAGPSQQTGSSAGE
jgi:hypothetical protein